MQTGGTNNVSQTLYLGDTAYRAGGTGTYNLSGSGLLSASVEEVGYTGTGTFTQTGGTNSVQTLALGDNPFLADNLGSGSYKLGGSGLLLAGNEYVGLTGTGAFAQTGGTNIVGTSLYLGYVFGSSGTYNLSGGLLVLTSFGNGAGAATFNFGGGTIQAGGRFPPVSPSP